MSVVQKKIAKPYPELVIPVSKGTCPSEKVLVSKNAKKNDFELTNLCY